MYGRTLGGTIVLLTIISASTTFAAEISAKSQITSATVFPTGAQITRKSKISLEAGEHTIILKDLPVEAIRDSIRVEGVANGTLEIGSVDTKSIYIFGKPANRDKSKRKEIENRIEELQDERSSIDGIIKALTTQKEYISQLTRLPSRPVSPQSTSVNTQQDWVTLFDLIGTKMTALNQQSLENQLKQRTIDKKIKELQKQLSTQPSKQDQRTQVKINIKALKDLEATLKIRYQIHNAGWKPFYDARLDTKGGPDKVKLSIIRRASVYQRSTEEWNNIKLSLSTTRPNRSTAAPNLRPLKVEIKEYKQKKRRVSRGYSQQEQNSVLQDSVSVMSKGGFAKPALAPRLEANQVRYTNVKQLPFQAIFEVPGEVTIKTKGEQKKVTLSKLDLSPKLKAITVPKVQPIAFLSTNFKLPKTAQILGGSVSLYRDGIYIGKGWLPDLASGVEHNLGFGSDDSIQVKFSEIDRSKGETGILSTSKTDVRNFKITVKNLHDWKIPVTVMDQIPYSENEKITVLQLPKTTKPTKTNVKDKRGVMSWDFDLKAGQEKQIDLSYKVVWPNEEKIIYRNR